jgi:hypothetical protein
MSDALARFESLKTNKQIELGGESGIDPWERVLRRVETRSGVIEVFNSDGKREWRVKSRYIFSHVLDIPPERTNGTAQGRRLRAVMHRLGWRGPRNLAFGKEQGKGYYKIDTSEQL